MDALRPVKLLSSPFDPVRWAAGNFGLVGMEGSGTLLRPSPPPCPSTRCLPGAPVEPKPCSMHSEGRRGWVDVGAHVRTGVGMPQQDLDSHQRALQVAIGLRWPKACAALHAQHGACRLPLAFCMQVCTHSLIGAEATSGAACWHAQPCSRPPPHTHTPGRCAGLPQQRPCHVRPGQAGAARTRTHLEEGQEAAPALHAVAPVHGRRTRAHYGALPDGPGQPASTACMRSMPEMHTCLA